MPRRSILSTAERDGLLAMPDAKDELIRLYTFNDADLAIIRQHPGPANRLGFAVQLCYMRYPDILLTADAELFAPLLRMVASQIKVPINDWYKYDQRAEKRREYLLELQSVFGFRTFGTQDYRPNVLSLHELAWQTDKGIVLATALVDSLRRQSVLLPTPNVIERVCAETVTRANRRIHTALTESLTTENRLRLDELLLRKEAARPPGSAGFASRPRSRTPDTCASISNVSRLGMHSICRLASKGRFIKTGCSRLTARAVR